MPTPTLGDDEELLPDEDDAPDVDVPDGEERRPSWWRRLVAGGARAGARGIRRIQGSRRGSAVDRAGSRRAGRRG